MIKRLLICFLLIVPVSLNSQNIDIRLLRSINSSATLPSDNFFRFVSNSEVYFALGIPAGLATAGLIRHDKDMLRNAGVTLAAAAINSGISLALKYTINRDRPFVTYPDIVKKGKSRNSFIPIRTYFKCFCCSYLIEPGLSEMVRYSAILFMGRDSRFFTHGSGSTLSLGCARRCNYRRRVSLSYL